MTQRTVERVIGRLVTDEQLRLDFILAPKATLAALAKQGWELTDVEVDALLRMDITLWSDAARRMDRRLLRCSPRTRVRESEESRNALRNGEEP